MIDAIRRRGWRAYATFRRRLRRTDATASALASFGRADRSDIEAWTAVTADGHERYRNEHPVPAESVAIVCVSQRVHLLDQVIDNVAAQTHAELELVFVPNSPDFDVDLVERAIGRLAHARVVLPPPGATLGAALNAAMAATQARFVAKFDDDDLYGAHYIADALRAHAFADAGVVGKHTYFAHLTAGDRCVIRFPAREFAYSATLAGGTLVIDRTVVGDQQFDDVSIGEDRAFLAQCHRRGVSTFAADRFNFVQTRGSDNTWTLPDDDFLVDTMPVDDTTEAFR